MKAFLWLALLLSPQIFAVRPAFAGVEDAVKPPRAQFTPPGEFSSRNPFKTTRTMPAYSLPPAPVSISPSISPGSRAQLIPQGQFSSRNPFKTTHAMPAYSLPPLPGVSPNVTQRDLPKFNFCDEQLHSSAVGVVVADPKLDAWKGRKVTLKMKDGEFFTGHIAEWFEYGQRIELELSVEIGDGMVAVRSFRLNELDTSSKEPLFDVWRQQQQELRPSEANNGSFEDGNVFSVLKATPKAETKVIPPSSEITLTGHWVAMARKLPTIEQDPSVLQDPERAQQHNQVVIMANQKLVDRVIVPKLGHKSPLEALKEIYRGLLNNFILTLPADKMNVAEQQRYAQVAFRSELGIEVLFHNLILTHSIDLPVILKEFSGKLDTMLHAAEIDVEVYRVAAWAKRQITELQPGVDANTRAGRAMFNYTIARYNHLTRKRIEAGHRLPPIAQTLPSVDFTRPEVRYATVKFEQGGQTREVSPFSDDLKDYCNEQVIAGLATFSKATGRPFFYFKWEGDPDVPGATVVTRENYYEKMVPEAPELDTIRDVMLLRMRHAELKFLAVDPEIVAEAQWLREYSSDPKNRITLP